MLSDTWLLTRVFKFSSKNTSGLLNLPTIKIIIILAPNMFELWKYNAHIHVHHFCA